MMRGIRRLFRATMNIIENGIKDGDFPSAAVAMGVGKELFFKEQLGYASVYPKRVVAKPGMLYDMASLTKVMVTTMLFLRLMEEGRISLEDRISKFYTELDEEKSSITMLNLLTHTSGLPAHIMLRDLTNSKEDSEKTILNSKLMFNPGKNVLYSCMGFIILGKILERSMGEELDELASKYVFQPLEMEHTQFCPTSDNVAATEFDSISGAYLRGIVDDENARFLGGVAGNCGVFSDIDDCIRFACMLSQRGKGFLREDTFNKAITNYTPSMASSRGLGFLLTDGSETCAGEMFSKGSYGHTGCTGTSLFVDRDTGFYAILLTNRIHYGRGTSGYYHLRRLFYNAAVTEFLRYTRGHK